MNKKFILLLLIATIVLGMPYFSRSLSDNNTLIGRSGYYEIRLASEGSISENYFNPYYLALSGFVKIFGNETAAYLFPFILGLLSLMLFYSILKMYDFKGRFWIGLLLVLSPLFTYSFVFLNKHAFAILIILLGTNLYMMRKKWSLVLAVIVFGLLPFIGLFPSIIAFVLLLNHWIIDKRLSKEIKYTFLFLALSFVLSVIINPFFLKERSLISFMVEDFISDLGGLTGFGVFSVILFAIGLFILWKRKYVAAYLSMGLLIISALYFGSYVNQYMNFLASLFAGYSFNFLLSRKWSLVTIKNFSIIVLVSGLIFSPISYTRTLIDHPADEAIVESLEWLNENSLQGEVVFSHYRSGFLIKGVADRPVVLDDDLYKVDSAFEKLNDSEKLFYGHDLNEAKDIFNKYSIKYIWIDEDTQNLVWERPEQGLLFLFRNSETFKKVYDQEGIMIWKVLK